MTRNMQKLGVIVFGFMLGLMPSLSAWAANSITAARVWPAQEYTRITLEAGNVIAYKVSTIKNPDRIVIDLEDVEPNKNLQSITDKVLSNDPYIKQIRVARFKPGVVRMVIDLKTEVKPTAFLLPPAGEYKHRLVLDIYPVKDPLMALLEQREQQGSASPTEGVSPAADVSQPKLAIEPRLSQQPQATESPSSASTDKPAETNKSTEAIQAANDNPKPSESNNKEGVVKGETRQIIIAIDAGHGGEDPGARGANGSHEKDITLAIARKLKDKVDSEPWGRAVLTRDGDYFIPLHGRVVKARKLQADLFVSIHADAFTNRSARGSSVFALSERGATSASARYLAKKENESDLIGGVSLDDKDPVLARTLLDLSLTATINDSLKLGKAVLGHIGEINTLHKKHVEQAGFAVLKSPDIPSILVETAFISNPEEERKLGDDEYQDKLVAAILEGIKQYFSTNPALAKTKLAVE